MAEVFTKYDTRGAYHWELIGERLPHRYSARLHALYSWFVDEIRVRRPVTLVDVGCGDAALTHLMARATPGQVFGIEPEATGVEFARSTLADAGSRAEVMAGRGEALPFESGSVDVVTMCEVVEHVEDCEPLLLEAARVLGSDGVLLISTPQWQHPELRSFHVREYLGTELSELLCSYFGQVSVAASEPGRLQDLYQSRRVARIAINLLSQAGFNPFSVRRPATTPRATWRQLMAVAEQPHRQHVRP